MEQVLAAKWAIRRVNGVSLASLRTSALVALTIAVLWTGCRLEIAERVGVPEPEMHDEFSYVLAADTFAHGRLANPAHPMGRFFESPHILVRPTYSSKYPPGQGLCLALGQWLFGSPFCGVVIEGAAMMFVFCLMLCAWTTLPAAVVISVVLAFYFSPPMSWVDSYWGGCVAATGGALVLFAVGRHRVNRWPLAGAVAGLGVLILFLTRPYEGGVFTLAVAAVYGYELWAEWRSGESSRLLIFAIGAVPVLLVGLLWSGYYNFAVTGSPFHLPYLVHERQYNVTPAFWFLPLRPEPPYTHARLSEQHGAHGWEAATYHQARSGRFSLARNVVKAVLSIARTNGPACALLLLLPLVWRDIRVRTMGMILGTFVLSLSVEVWHSAHYAAPAAAALAVVSACTLERTWSLGIRKVAFSRALISALLVLACAASFTWERVRVPDKHRPTSFGKQRAELIRRLSVLDRPQLVVVRYPSPSWRAGDEWVYNHADIDHQHVIFAHDLGDKENRSLLCYYNGRRAWLLTFDPSRPGFGYHLSPYAYTDQTHERLLQP